MITGHMSKSRSCGSYSTTLLPHPSTILRGQSLTSSHRSFRMILTVLKRHKRTPIWCPVCPLSIQTHTYLVSHMSALHPNAHLFGVPYVRYPSKRTPIWCPVCPLSIQTHTYLVSHVSALHPNAHLFGVPYVRYPSKRTPIWCPVCPLSIQTHTYLVSRMSALHPNVCLIP